MKIVSLNKNIERYHYASEMEYNSPSFKGHQIGLIIAKVNPATGEVEKNYVPGKDNEEKTGTLRAILEDKSLMLLEDKITQYEDGKFSPKLVYYMPYYVENHSAYKPPVNYANITDATNVKQAIEWEVILADEQGWYNRYFNFTTESGSMRNNAERCPYFYEMIEGLEQEFEDMLEDSTNTEVTRATHDGDEYEKGDILITFYDKIGQQFVIGFKNYSDILRCITSVRMIDYKCEIVD